MKRRFYIFVVCCVIVVLSGRWLESRSFDGLEECTQVANEPNICPDYSGVVMPHNIAPLNFRILEKGSAYYVRIHADSGAAIEIGGKTDQVRIPLRKWRALLDANKGREVFVDVYVKDADKGWRQFQRITNTIAEESIDETLVFRFMRSLYQWWKNIGIYQRNLTGYDVSPVMHGRCFYDGCVNCHSFVGNAPDMMTIGMRSSKYGSNTLLARNGGVHKIGTKWGYTSWHPSGRLAVYSMNKVRMFFHSSGMEVRDVVDLDAALACYHVESEKVVCPRALADKDRLETYPAWSPDGKYLYFCSAPFLWKDRNTVPPENYEKLKYDLLRVAYDVETGRWGEVETVLSAEKTGLSILLPRISPDGRFLVFCMCRYGCFPIYQPSSDLYLMDLATGDYHKLDINSEYSESWHSWSSNSRWIAFSSKRQGGVLTRTYIGYVDENGRAYKPFVLPQKDPTYYDSLLETYSVPELVKGRVEVSKSMLARAARSEPDVVVDIPITGATPLAAPSGPYRERE